MEFFGISQQQLSSDEDSSTYKAPPYSPLSDIVCPAGVGDSRNQESDSTEVSTSDQDTNEDISSSDKDEQCSYSYKIVGDNVDKNVRPSLQRHEIQGQSLHHFHAYAARSRVSVSSLSDIPPITPIPDPSRLIPSEEDLSCIREEMSVLLSRYT